MTTNLRKTTLKATVNRIKFANFAPAKLCGFYAIIAFYRI